MSFFESMRACAYLLCTLPFAWESTAGMRCDLHQT